MKRFSILGLAAACAGLLAVCVQACTIFVLTDATRTFFFNNEDWSNPNCHLWFVPGGKDFYGCAYVGFDDGWAQGGLNTQGLACDWVAGFDAKWKPERGMKKVRGNSNQRMLETCATVEEAIAFFRRFAEPSFARARILVADRTGASAIIGYQDGKLHIEPSSQGRGFGYGQQTLEQMLAASSEPGVDNGIKILRACQQKGTYATKYSNGFDLRNGDMFFFLPGRTNEVKLHLAAELEKGGHYYDLPRLDEQLSHDPKPLRREMLRFVLDEYKPIPDPEPRITKRLRAIVQDASQGEMKSADYTAELWNEISPKRGEVQADLKRLGPLRSFKLVERKEEDAKRSYRYRIDFKNAAVLQSFVLTEDNKVAASQSEGLEWK